MPKISEVFGKVIEKFEPYPNILLEWMRAVKEDCRIENCLTYIQKCEMKLPFEQGDVEGLDDPDTLDRWNTQLIAGFLFAAGAPLVFSPKLVDALVRPRQMYEITTPSYAFFLAYAHEHEIIRNKLRQMVEYGNTILIVHPAVYADRGIVAWIYDPLHYSVYTLKPYVLSEKEISQGRSQGKFISVGSKSTLESYTGWDHPFTEMMERAYKLDKVITARDDANDYHIEIPAVYFF